MATHVTSLLGRGPSRLDCWVQRWGCVVAVTRTANRQPVRTLFSELFKLHLSVRLAGSKLESAHLSPSICPGTGRAWAKSAPMRTQSVLLTGK